MRVSPTTSERASSSGSERARRAAFVVALTALPSACSLRACSADDQPITYVDIVDSTKDDPHAPATLDRKKLEASIAEAMKRWPGFAFRAAKKDEVSWQLDVRIELMTERTAIPEGDEDPASVEGMKRRTIGGTMDLHALGVRTTQNRFVAEVLYAKNVDPKVDFDEVARQAILAMADRVRFGIELKDESPETIVKMLSSEDEQRRLAAIAIIAERKLTAAIPRLSDMVRDQEQKDKVLLAAIGALVAIDDPSAVPALIDAGRQRPPGFLAPILFGIAKLGGRDAKGYLFTVASGHPVEALRAVAQEALDELEAREVREGRERVEPEAP